MTNTANVDRITVKIKQGDKFMKKNLVTVMTPCYNGEKYIKTFMDSILKQTYPEIEVIIIDDGSTDKTEEIVKSYEGPMKARNITLKYSKQKNQGQAVAANKGLKQVEGEFLVWPDSDDYYEENAIENMANFLKQHEDYNAVRAEVAFRKEGEEKEIVEIRKSKNPENTDLFLNYIQEEDTYCFTGMMMIRVEHFFQVNKGKEIYQNRAGQNWQIILPSVYHSKTGYIDKVVYNVVMRSNSHSRRKESMKDVLLRMQNHRKILKRTVEKIIEDDKEKEKYLKIIKDKYDTRQRDYIQYKIKHWKE